MAEGDVVFYVFAVVTVGSAAVVVLARSLIYSAFALLFTFFGVAGLYVLLGADFLAATQLLIYVGGILVLLLFGVMLTHKLYDLDLRARSRSSCRARSWPAGLFVVLAATARRTEWATATGRARRPPPRARSAGCSWAAPAALRGRLDPAARGPDRRGHDRAAEEGRLMIGLSTTSSSPPRSSRSGVLGVLTRRNAVNVLMGIELILNSANINLVAFSRYGAGNLDGQLFAVFVIVIAAAEVAVALAIVLTLYRLRRTPEPRRSGRPQGLSACNEVTQQPAAVPARDGADRRPAAGRARRLDRRAAWRNARQPRA